MGLCLINDPVIDVQYHIEKHVNMVSHYVVLSMIFGCSVLRREPGRGAQAGDGVGRDVHLGKRFTLSIVCGRLVK